LDLLVTSRSARKQVKTYPQRYNTKSIQTVILSKILDTMLNHSNHVYTLIPVLFAASPFIFQDFPPGMQCKRGASCCSHYSWKNPRQCLALSGEGECHLITDDPGGCLYLMAFAVFADNAVW